MSEGYFKVSSIKNLDDLQLGDKLSTSDFATLTKEGKFVQLEYVEEENKIEHYKVKPGIYSIISTISGLRLEPTSFTSDKVLTNNKYVELITSQINSFFSKVDIYTKYGYAVAKRAWLLWGNPGCHARGTGILMFDGTIKKVENINVGDFLMGPDSKPREVLQLASGREKLVKIIPNKGPNFIVNYNHILHLQRSSTQKTNAISSPLNIKFSDYLNNTTICFRDRLKLKLQSIEFNQKNLPIEPYILGMWLGDGDSAKLGLTTADVELENRWKQFAKDNNLDIKEYINRSNARCKQIRLSSFEKTKGKNFVLNEFHKLNLINNKHIPLIYKTSSREQRLQLLAGLIDTDGYTYGNIATKGLGGKSINYVTKLETLADDIVYLGRSLGFMVTKSIRYKSAYIAGKPGIPGKYYSLSISGNTEQIPCLLERKRANPRKQIKNVSHIGFKYEILPEDDYFGFSLSGDHLYLTDDFIVHHNTGKSTLIRNIVASYDNLKDTCIVLWPSDKIDPYEVKQFIKKFQYIGVNKLILVIEDLGGVEVDQVRIKSMSSLLSLLDNVEATFTISTAILSTTNFPENFLGNITNRPQRFDTKIEISAPNGDERVQFLNFFCDRTIDEDVKQELLLKKYNKLTPAHLKEIPMRAELNDLTMLESLLQIQKEIDVYEKMFDTTKQKLGITEPDYD